MLIISHKQLLQCFFVHFCRYFMNLNWFTSLNLRYCHYPLNLNYLNFNIAPYEKNQKNEILKMTKCTGTKLLPHNFINLTFWTIFFTENIRYPFNIFPVIGIWGTKYLTWILHLFDSFKQIIIILKRHTWRRELRYIGLVLICHFASRQRIKLTTEWD